MAGSPGKYFNKMSLRLLLYSVDNYIYFIEEYRKFEKLSVNFCVLKIQMIFNYDEVLAENLTKKWKQMGNDFTRFFLNLNTFNQKQMLNDMQIPIAAKQPLYKTGYPDMVDKGYCAFSSDGLADINHLLFYFNNRTLDQPIAGVKLPHIPEGSIKNWGSGSTWADYIISLPYEEQVFVLLIILQN